LEKRYQVFVSSTFADLKDERQKVMQTLMKMDCIPAGMELFPATDEEQFEFIKRIIDDCDYYLLIIGGRYGSITAQGISYTEQEYKYALERKLKVIALLHKNPDQIPFDKSEQTPELRVRLQDFRDKAATGRVVEFWKNAEELPGIVALSLINTIKIFPAIGWVRADKVSSEELLIEINELRKKNTEISKALSEIEPSIFTGSEDKDFSYIYGSLNRLENIDVTIKSKTTNTDDFVIKNYSLNLASLIPFISKSEIHEYDWDLISSMILDDIFPNRVDNIDNRKIFSVAKTNNLTDELVMYGFLTKNYISPDPANSMMRNKRLRKRNYWLSYSEKLERYKYWLNVNGKMPEYIEINEKSE